MTAWEPAGTQKWLEVSVTLINVVMCMNSLLTKNYCCLI